ncbi:MAG: hypothetical protein Q9180_004367 [Flavoplaca navasiana]
MEEDYACTISGTPYDHGNKDRPKHVRLRERKMLSSALKEKKSSEVPSLTPTGEELDTEEGDDRNVLWKLSQLSVAGDRRGRSRRPNEKAKQEEGRQVVPTDPEAIRAVVRCTSKHNKVYGLVDSQEGLCEGLVVPFDETFFFTEFRNDGVLATTKRTTMWSGLIHEHLHGAQSRQEGADLSARFDRLVVRVP